MTSAKSQEELSKIAEQDGAVSFVRQLD